MPAAQGPCRWRAESVSTGKRACGQPPRGRPQAAHLERSREPMGRSGPAGGLCPWAGLHPTPPSPPTRVPGTPCSGPRHPTGAGGIPRAGVTTRGPVSYGGGLRGLSLRGGLPGPGGAGPSAASRTRSAEQTRSLTASAPGGPARTAACGLPRPTVPGTLVRTGPRLPPGPRRACLPGGLSGLRAGVAGVAGWRRAWDASCSHDTPPAAGLASPVLRLQNEFRVRVRAFIGHLPCARPTQAGR